MSQSRFPPRLVAGIIVALFFGVALYLRVALPYDQVFVGDWIKFTGCDAYYYMRLVDNLLHHFPQLITFDPYTFYPHGAPQYYPPLFSLFLGGIIWLVGLGSPTQHTIDVVGVYFPAVLAALTVVPVYFIGKALFNRWAGVIAAGLIAILPGEFLGRSILGFTDHHVAEVLFTTIAMLFLILAVKTARQKGLTFSHVKHWDWTIITKPLTYSLLAGAFLGNYLLMWAGGLLFVFIIFVYFIIQFLIDYSKHESIDYLCFVGTLSFLVASVITLPLLPQYYSPPLYFISLSIAILTPLVLSVISKLMASKEVRPAYYPLTLIGLGLAGLALFYVVNPALLKSMLGQFGIFAPSGVELTILEVQPILFPGGNFSLSVAWANFTTGFFLSFISLGILIYFIIKRGEADKTLFVVWSLVILAATLGQRRFAYYFAINVALLTGYFSWLILQFAGFRETAAEPVEAPEKVERKAKRKKRRGGGFRPTTSRANMALGAIVVFFLSFFPNFGGAINTASHAVFAPDDAWCESLSWLKENTADPFGNPDFYYELCEPPPQGEDYKYPDSAYGVMAWWDYGHWITRISHRLPNHAPGGGRSAAVARCFIAQDEASADEIVDKLDSRYVIIDHATATTKFYALATWAGSSKQNFYDVYHQPQEGRLVPVVLFYPEYYRSLATRLYNFDGSSVAPQSPTVISYQERIGPEGEPYKEITSLQSFPSYEAATNYIATQESDNYRIVGTDPFISPVPLKALEHYQLIYSSDSSIMQPNIGRISLVKIFEYID